MNEEESNVIKDESAIAKYISSREQIESTERLSWEALQKALQEAVSYRKAEALYEAMHVLTEYIAGVNAKLNYRSCRLTAAFPSPNFRFSTEDASVMLDLYKLRSIYIIKRELISRAFSTLPTANFPNAIVPSDWNSLEKDADFDVDEEPITNWESDLKDENLESFAQNTIALTNLMPSLIVDFERLLLRESRPLPLISVLESIDETLNLLDQKIQGKTAVLSIYEDEKKSVLIKRLMVLNRLKDILADT